MHDVELQLKNLLKDDQKYIFIAGAGCSIDSPSNLPSCDIIKEELIKFICAKSEIESILKIEGLRFEILLEIIRNQLDNNLKILDYFEECTKPNLIHYFLADMINKRHIFVGFELSL